MIPTTMMSWDAYFMHHVYLAASKSKDPRTKIGAVLVRDGVVVSEGFNGIARGVEDLPERLNDKETKYKYIVHAEANSVLNAARNGIRTSGCTLYTQGIPCNECAKAVIQAGIEKIIIHSNWPNMPSEKWIESVKISNIMFKEAGIPVSQMEGLLGVKGYIDGKILNV